MAPKRAKRKVAKKQSGKGYGEVLSKINKIAKDTKILTTALNTLAPESGIAQTVSGVADQLGYGRKKKKQKGKGFGDILGNILGGVGGGIGMGINRTLGGLFGGSRQRGGMRLNSFAVNPMMIR